MIRFAFLLSLLCCMVAGHARAGTKDDHRTQCGVERSAADQLYTLIADDVSGDDDGLLKRNDQHFVQLVSPALFMYRSAVPIRQRSHQPSPRAMLMRICVLRL